MRIFNFILLLSALTYGQILKAEPGVVVLAGGGPEGDIGVKSDWSYSLYKRLIENGDTTGDKKIKVVVLSLEKPDSNFMVDYLKSMGADSSQNLVVSSKKEANSPKVTAALKDADVVFIRGGNQGKAYQLWKGTKVQEQLKALADRGGAIGGTSSGAMGLSGYSITGGRDFDSKEVLSDSHSPLLNDLVNPETSGIHDDFLNAVPGVMADTHCGERGRVGRLLGAMAKATDDFKDNKMVSLCIEEKTGVAISKGKAQVYGTGSVHFLSETDETKKERIPGKPLTYTGVRDDSLTEGWSYDLHSRLPDTKNTPKDTKIIFPNVSCASVSDHLNMKSSAAPRLTFSEPAFSSGLTIAEDAYSDEKLISRDRKKGVMQTMSYVKLANNPNGSVVMMDSASHLKSTGGNNIMINGSTPTMILDCEHCTHTSTSSFISTQNQEITKGKELHSKALVNMRVHVIGSGDTYNIQTHEITLARDLTAQATATCSEVKITKEIFEKLYSDEQNIVHKLNCPR